MEKCSKRVQCTPLRVACTWTPHTHSLSDLTIANVILFCFLLLWQQQCFTHFPISVLRVCCCCAVGSISVLTAAELQFPNDRTVNSSVFFEFRWICISTVVLYRIELDATVRWPYEGCTFACLLAWAAFLLLLLFATTSLVRPLGAIEALLWWCDGDYFFFTSSLAAAVVFFEARIYIFAICTS